MRDPHVRIIDASSAHRTDEQWVYGFAEMMPGQAARIASASRVSNPGCYPTGAIGLLRPLRHAGLLAADAALSIHAVSGYSGQGRAGIQTYESGAGEAQPPLQLYGLSLEHKHIPEIARYADLSRRPVFSPAYAAYRQGIALTIALHPDMLEAGTDAATLRNCLQRHYADCHHVKVLDEAHSGSAITLDATALNGTDDLLLAVFGNEHTRQFLLVAIFDNLGKGAAGAAVQNLDLMLGRRSVPDRAPNLATDESIDQASTAEPTPVSNAS